MPPLALPRLVRNDSITRGLRSSKSAGELLPRSHAHSAADALPDFQRCASAEDSTGWVDHEEFLAQRCSTRSARRKRCAEFVLPKLMSSFEDSHGVKEDSCPVSHTAGTLQDAEILGTTTQAQDDIGSSARRNRFFEPLNDTTGRPKRVFRKTSPPPITRGGSTSDVLTPEGGEGVENWVL